jgi:tetratricopeptide (TPR) repeat protein
VILLTLILGCDGEPAAAPAAAPAAPPAEVAPRPAVAPSTPEVPVVLPEAPLSPELQVIAGQLTERKLDAARAALDAWLIEHPEDADALYLKGESYMVELKWAEADAAFTRAVQLRPDFADARKRLLGAQVGQRKCAEVFEGITAYQALRPDDPEVLVMRSFCRGAQGDHEGALADVVLACEQGFTDACAVVPRLEGRLAWINRKKAEQSGQEPPGAPAPEAPPQ